MVHLNETYLRFPDEKLAVSPQVRSSLEDIKRVKINPPKNGRMYPTLSDIESGTDSDKYITANCTDDDHEELTHRYAYSSQDDEDR